MEELCSLCKTNKADKKNSHIVPKFLTKSLRPLTGPKKIIVFFRNGKEEERQDTPKEDYILCKLCEKRIGVLEAIFAPLIRQIHKFETYTDFFKYVIEGQREFIVCKSINSKQFKLFLLSIIWRLSISRLHDFGKFNLPADIEEQIRMLLDETLKPTHKFFVNHFHSIDKDIFPDFHIVLIKPKIQTNPPGGMLSAYSQSNEVHLITLVDFILYFIIDDAKIHSALRSFSNKGMAEFIIGLCENSRWVEFNKWLFAESRKKNGD